MHRADAKTFAPGPAQRRSKTPEQAAPTLPPCPFCRPLLTSLRAVTAPPHRFDSLAASIRADVLHASLGSAGETARCAAVQSRRFRTPKARPPPPLLPSRFPCAAGAALSRTRLPRPPQRRADRERQPCASRPHHRSRYVHEPHDHTRSEFTCDRAHGAARPKPSNAPARADNRARGPRPPPPPHTIPPPGGRVRGGGGAWRPWRLPRVAAGQRLGPRNRGGGRVAPCSRLRERVRPTSVPGNASKGRRDGLSGRFPFPSSHPARAPSRARGARPRPNYASRRSQAPTAIAPDEALKQACVETIASRDRYGGSHCRVVGDPVGRRCEARALGRRGQRGQRG